MITKIFLNTHSDRHHVSKEPADLLDYVNNGEIKDEFTSTVNNLVDKLRNASEREARYMTYEQTIMEAERSGEERGRIEGKVEAIRNLMDTMNFTAEKAMKVLKIPASDFAKYLQML